MKRVSAWLLSGILLLLVGASGLSQQYDLQFRVDQDDNVAAGNFDVTLRIAANDTASIFELGSCNLVFDYNTASLTAPGLIGPGPDSLQIQAIHNFSGGNYQKLRLTQPSAGRLSLNIELNAPGTGTTVLPTFMDIATIRFTIADPAQAENLAWRTASPNATLVFDQNETALALADSLYGPALLANLKVILEGAYDTLSNAMRTNLKDGGYLPLLQPYSQSPWFYGKADTVAAIPADVVDWVLIELRNGTSGADSIDSRAAFLKNDGSIVDLNGISPVAFTVPAGTYYVVIYHRNHLGVMSSVGVSMAETAPATQHDFSTGQTQVYGTDALSLLETGVYGMPGGETNKSGIITNADKSPIINNLNQVGYYNADVNMSGIVTNSDKSLIINNLNQFSQIPSGAQAAPVSGGTPPNKNKKGQSVRAENYRGKHIDSDRTAKFKVSTKNNEK